MYGKPLCSDYALEFDSPRKNFPKNTIISCPFQKRIGAQTECSLMCLIMKKMSAKIVGTTSTQTIVVVHKQKCKFPPRMKELYSVMTYTSLGTHFVCFSQGHLKENTQTLHVCCIFYSATKTQPLSTKLLDKRWSHRFSHICTHNLRTTELRRTWKWIWIAQFLSFP